jgi:hypothetical protein
MFRHRLLLRPLRQRHQRRAGRASRECNVSVGPRKKQRPQRVDLTSARGHMKRGVATVVPSIHSGTLRFPGGQAHTQVRTTGCMNVRTVSSAAGCQTECRVSPPELADPPAPTFHAWPLNAVVYVHVRPARRLAPLLAATQHMTEAPPAGLPHAAVSHCGVGATAVPRSLDPGLQAGAGAGRLQSTKTDQRLHCGRCTRTASTPSRCRAAP